MKCPAQLYTASPRRYDGLPELTYPFHDRDILVTACRRLCLHRKRINISSVLAGQKLGIKEVDDGIWLASFMRYDLGYFDLEQKTLQPLDNPFGTRLSCYISTPLVRSLMEELNVLGNRLQVLRRPEESAGDSDRARTPCEPHRSAPERSQ